MIHCGQRSYYLPVNPTNLFLYVAEDCCLCDEAVAVLAEAQAPDFESISIEDDARLCDRYAVLVPVLHDAIGNRDLCWPFDADEVRQFLAARLV